MSEKRRGLGRGIGALIPSGPTQGTGTARPIDVFFTSSGGSAASADETRAAGAVALALAAPSTAESSTPVALPAPTGPPSSQSTTTGEVVEEPAAGTPAAAREPASDESVMSEPEDGDLLPVPGATFAEIPIGSIVPNARQPRQVFDEDELEELAASIREVGVLQPVVVRRAEAPGAEAAYELIMGERRWRASELAGSTTVPAIIRDTGDGNLLRDALLENLHRTQLNPLEEAAAYRQLLDDFGCTHDELAGRIARSRPQISNTLRLLKLPPLVQRRVAAGVLSAGHARALLGLADGGAMERLAQRIVAEGLSVRATEEIVALGDEPVQPEMRRRPRNGAHSETLDRLAGRLTDQLDTRVKVTMGQRKGRIAIEFAGLEDLERILSALGEEPAEALRASR
ncbi:ParB/RepB/Spo0J family partition protein [Georgenia sp. 10Sc9-8]|uniref:ParB/RepB/Spo0J family partition protein n=1 Tax=Georgenia halotolerans TaxID=3028317 RepID=A0ABT5TV75_9MICO|nr:ParB/RepB/Spo0J family partition protein [Georgenia halotolerans]